MKKSIARVIAREQGEEFYTPENPCLKGHLHRRVSDGSCTVCKRELDKKRTVENRLAYNARKKRERRNYLPQLALKMCQRRANESPEQRVIRLEKSRVKQIQWRENNPDHAGARIAKSAYKKRNPGKTQANTSKRRTSKMRRTPAWLIPDDFWIMEQAYELAVLRTKMFGFSWHVDHVIPLQGRRVSGLHVPTNLQVIPWRDNVVKANKYLPA